MACVVVTEGVGNLRAPGFRERACGGGVLWAGRVAHDTDFERPCSGHVVVMRHEVRYTVHDVTAFWRR